jgi:PST family polysaccharide transporter
VAVGLLNVDYMVVGRALGPIALGFYLMAFNLSSWPVNMFSTAVARVSVAGFARLQRDIAALRAAFLRSLTLLMVATVPVCALLSALALPLVRFLYGGRWALAASALHWLAVLGAIRVGLQLCTDLLVAVGKGGTTLRLQSLWLVTLVPALAIGAEVSGIAGVGGAHVAVGLGVAVPAFLFALHLLGMSPAASLRAVGRPVFGGLLAAGLAVAAVSALSGDIATLAVGGTAGLLAYGAVVFPLRTRLRPSTGGSAEGG